MVPLERLPCKKGLIDNLNPIYTALIFRDSKGNIAVATSTGGITGKLPGRIGDTPIIGSGTYADNRIGGASSTGHGETIMRSVLTHDVMKRMDYLKEDVQTATENACKNMTERFFGTGGVIALDKTGKVGIHFTSQRMAWAYQKLDKVYYGIEPDDHYEQLVVRPYYCHG